MTHLKTSYCCGTSSEPLIYDTIGSYLDKITERNPNNLALVVRHQGVRWTYREYKERIERLAAGLIRLGIRPGDRVGMWGPNSAEWALVQLATAKMGAILVCINPAYRINELEFALNKVRCKALVSAERFKSSEYLIMLRELAPELAHCEPGRLSAKRLPHLEIVIRLGAEKTPGMLNFAEVCAAAGEEDYDQLGTIQKELSPDDPINILFTSGTTGNPKGATLTHCNSLNNALIHARVMKFAPQDRICIPVPLYHCMGMILGNLGCLVAGAAAVYPNDAFDPGITLQTLQDEKCTAMHGVPTMFVMMLDHPSFAEYDLSTLRTGIMAGAPCPIEIMRRVIDDMNMKEVLIGYGLTESTVCNHVTEIDDPLEKRVETVGRAMSWTEAKIVDDRGRIVPIGVNGEVCVRGFGVMRGYWDDQQKTADAIDEQGWLHSGDIGVMDGDGYVRIVGRLKDMIIRGGENIYPREVEELLYAHPKIAEVQVFGVTDPTMGEEVCAWIKPRESEQLTEEEVISFCKDKISYFKIPKYVRFVTEYPMTVTGKIQKNRMRERMQIELGNA